jgi:hypothetical protein
VIETLHHLTNSEYRAYQAVSQSDLKMAARNPQLYYETYLIEPAHRRRPRLATSPEQQFGIAVEEFLRTSAMPEDLVVIPPDVLNAQGHRRGSAWTAFVAEHEGKQLVTQKEFDQQMGGIMDAAANVRAHKVAELLLNSVSAKWHQRFVWLCEDTMLPMKAELDILDDGLGVVCDVKTAADTDADSFARSVLTFGYDIQAAHYLEAAELAYPTREWTFAWVVIKNKPPYDVEVYDASDELLKHGETRLMAARENYRRCVDSGTWKSATHGISVNLDLPAWARGRTSI